MNIHFFGNYKSLSDFEWNDIPQFCVLTGTNGSGKTQLLELLNHSLNDTVNRLLYPRVRVSIDGETFRKGEVAFFPSDWQLHNVQAANLNTIQQVIRNLYNQFTNPSTQVGPWLDYLFQETVQLLGKPR